MGMKPVNSDTSQSAGQEPDRLLILSIIIPVYNEEATIQEVVERIQTVDFPKGVEAETIVVNDGSSDRTLEVLQRMKGITVICQENQGKGSAIISGLNVAKGDYVVIQDADLEYHPEEIPSLLGPVLQSQARVVYGSRKLKKNRHSSILFDLGGMFLSFLTNLLYGSAITDEPTGYKLVETRLMNSLGLKRKGFDFCPEITAKILRLGIPIHEVPISYSARPFSKGKKIRARDGLIAVWTLLKLRFEAINTFGEFRRSLTKQASFKGAPGRPD